MAPIGVFDSGAGGLLVWQKIVEILPNQSTVFYADIGNCPYGSKSKEVITEYSDNITKFLLSKGCESIVIACNTATSAAVDYLREKYDVPFIGIEPATKPASLKSKTHTIGILATKATLESELFNKTKLIYENTTKIIPTAGIGLVEIVETGKQGTEESLNLLHKYIDPIIKQGADKIVLGCTHYPYLMDDIKTVIGNRKVEIIDPSSAVGVHLKHVLKEHNLLMPEIQPNHTFYHSGNGTVFERLIKDRLGIVNPNIIAL